MVLPTPSSFSFPYATPYSIQQDCMEVLFKSIETSKITFIQSPTGTGKSLSLLCGSLTWLEDHRKSEMQRKEQEVRQELEASMDPDEPRWVLEQTISRRINELQSANEELEARLQAIRNSHASSGPPAYKRGRVDGVDSGMGRKKLSREEDEKKFLLYEPSGVVEEPVDDKEEFSNLSPEVRAMMKQFAPKAQAVLPPPPPSQTKIFLSSRTHTQLSQMTSELRRTRFSEYIKLVPLSSRRQLCINPSILSSSNGTLDERCKDLGSGCKFKKEKGSQEEREFVEEVLANVGDIEDLRGLSEKKGCCGYYAGRSAMDYADVVLLPYNLLLLPSAREALGINLKDHVVLIDEAHNLIDSLLSLHTISITTHTLSLAKSQLTAYLQKFKTKLSGLSILRLSQLLLLIQGLSSIKSPTEKNGSGQLLGVNEVMEITGKGADGVNVLEVVAWAKEARLAGKVSSYGEAVQIENLNTRNLNGAMTAKKLTSSQKQAAITSLQTLLTFLLSLSNSEADGRVLVTTTTTAVESTGEVKEITTLKYLLLNPQDTFKPVVEDARAIVMAGGTMEPISDFHIQLFPAVPKDRFANFSCGHVIPKENLKTLVFTKGPKGGELEFRFDKRGDSAMLEELGSALSNICNLVPAGVVVFFPSYAFLDKVKTTWSGKGRVLEKLNGKKTVFYEPQQASEVEKVLEDYSNSIKTPTATGKKGGAILFAVVGAKLSEGINFSDDMARAVVMVGLPFPNLASPELKERMSYVTNVAQASKVTQGDKAGRELYMNLCMKAVNQSIGRAIRHAGDYSTLILLDKRYSTPQIQGKLPGWIGEDVKMLKTFGEGVKEIATFFKSKIQF